MGDLIKLDILDNIYTDKCNFNQKLLPFATSGVILATVKSAVILSQGDDVKTVYDLSLSLEEKHEYLPGDTIGIIPKNDATEVEQLLSRLNVLHVADYECNLSISEKTTKKNPSLPKHIPTVRSLRTIFLNDIDLRSPPKKLFLKALLKYTSNPDEIQRLEHLTSTAGSKDYINFISTEGRTLLKLLQAFPSCNPPIEIILEHSVMLQARPYSISSSPLADDYLHVTFFIVENSDGSKGVCTGWLENLINQGGYRKLPIYFRKPTDFRIQADLSVPTIMIGTGTGISPFIGFLQHMAIQMHSQGNTSYHNWLIHGCRYENKDALYNSEIARFLKSGILTKYSLCTSRDTHEKCYVQDSILKYGDEFVKYVIKMDAVVYICGEFKTVIKDVKSKILEVLCSHGSLSKDDAENYYSSLEKNKRIIIDSWI